MVKTITVLISGNGTNLQSLIDYKKLHPGCYNISQVISNKSNAYGLERAKSNGIKATVLIKTKEMTKEEYDTQLTELVGVTDLVVCAGFLRILTSIMIERFTIINIHPALSNGYIGLNAIERAFSDHQCNKLNYSGVMVHYVSAEVDRGRLIIEKVVPIYPNDNLSSFSERIHSVEHMLIVQAVKIVLE